MINVGYNTFLLIIVIQSREEDPLGVAENQPRMAMPKFLVLALACTLAQALPRDQPALVSRNTIFADEKLHGEVFEDVDAFNDIQLFNENNPYRLPTVTRPIHYDVFWAIEPTDRTYNGTVDIQLVATQPGVNEITIHSAHNTLTRVSLSQGNQELNITYRYEPVYQFLIVRPNVDLEYNAANPVVYNLSIDFAAPMGTNMYGIYESWYRTDTSDPNSPLSWMATTQFQSTSSRNAFPCYDEPSFKATFNITIRRPDTHRSWSCTRIRTTSPVGTTGYSDDIYHTTPIMSTYLLALIVAEYDSVEALNAEGLLAFEVIARPQAINTGQGDYAFQVGQELLAEMSSHTARDFYSVNPNLKMTQAAIPDFSAGAMENWGLLTYREAYLLYDPNHTNSYFRQLIAYILSHEIAHMWFGNLVTCDWWDVLWLNEGFARYYQYFLTHWVETEMGFETRFIIEQVHTALLSDSANNPHPLSNSGVGSPGAVSAMFSTISYNKGAAIIRQSEHFIGFEVQRQGLRNYLQQRSHQSALPIDLFQDIENAAVQQGALVEYGPNFNFIEYFRSWTEQPGHPVINVNVNHATGDMTITQRRFNINSGYSSNNHNYIVPISFASASNPDFSNTKPTHVLTDTVAVINRGSVGDEWVIFNKQQTGFYRVNYDDYTWDLIALALRGNDRTLIHEYNRAQIVNDVFQFARSGLMTYARAFDILSFLQYETEYAPWVAALTGFTWIRNRLVGTPTHALLNNLISNWANTVMQDLTYYPIANESFMRSYLRYQLAPLMCNIGVQACRDAANQQFQALVSNGVEVPVDSRNWVYCNGLRDGSEADFNYMWNRFLTHNVYTEKILMLQTLGCTPHPNSLNTFLDGIMQDNYIVRAQDYTTALSSAVSGNEVNTQIAFSYMQNNLPLLTSAFGSPATPLSYVSSRLRTEAEINAFQNWATQNQAALGSAFNAVYNGAESSRQSIQWANSVSPDMSSYFTNGGANLTTSTQAPPTTVSTTTIQPDNLVEPETPTLPDSAVNSFVSISLLSLGVLVHYFL